MHNEKGSARTSCEMRWSHNSPLKSKAEKKISKVMKEYKAGDLYSGSGSKVKSKKQAVAIALSEARKKSPSFAKKYPA
jgi:hypothetical protein